MNCPNCKSKKIDSTETLHICTDCGFHTEIKSFVELSIDYQIQPKTGFDRIMLRQPKIVQDLKIFDDNTNSYWIPIVSNHYPVFTYSPIGSIDSWEYMIVPYKVIPLLDRENYPDPINIGKFLEYTLDFDNTITYPDFKTMITDLEL